MTLFVEADSPLGHAVRIVLAEKDISVDVIVVDADRKPEDLIDLNPYNDVLTLVDRELVLYEAQVMLEYLDERFPHPPLMPVDPVSRANNRQIRYRIMRDLYRAVDDIAAATSVGNDSAAASARRVLRDNLTSISPALAVKPYFLSDEFSLVDCCIMPLLWRLDAYAVKLPPQAKPLLVYAERLFARPAFRACLTGVERQMRAA